MDDVTDDLPRTTRRVFLQVLAASAAVPAALGCGSSAMPEAVGDVVAGAAAALSVGTIRPIQGFAVCIARDASGIYAMTLTCTHQGCDIGAQGLVSSSGLVCFCHGSQFDVNGNVVHGPAREPLQHFAVSADAKGNLTIHGDSPVDAATRLMV